MKRRIEKKVEKRRRDKIHELLDLTLDINSTMPREQEKTGNKPTAFLIFRGIAGFQLYRFMTKDGRQELALPKNFGYIPIAQMS